MEGRSNERQKEEPYVWYLLSLKNTVKRRGKDNAVKIKGIKRYLQTRWDRSSEVSVIGQSICIS